MELKKIPHWVEIVIWILGIALFCLCIYRAYHLSFTHDESYTYLKFHKSPLLKFITHQSAWPNANNHLLNTYLMQGSIALFGTSDFTLRLPNVLSYGIYIFASYQLGKHLFGKTLFLVLFFVLACANPYAFDFFSLCRGYGLSMAFEMLSLFYAFKYIKDQSFKNLSALLISLFLMSFALMSTLIIIPAILGAIFFLFLERKSLNGRHIIAVLGFLIFCSFVFYVPLSALSKNGEFNFGAKKILDSLQNFSAYFVYHKSYLGTYTNTLFLGFLLISFLTLSFNNILSKNKEAFNDYYRFLIYTISLILLGLVGSRYLLGTFYPIERKTLLLFPFACLIMTRFTEIISSNRFLKPVSFILLFFASFHFYHAHQINKTREWWYDAETKKIVSIIKEDASDFKVQIATNWLFYPSTNYYLQINGMDNVQMAKHSKKIMTQSQYDYYLCIGPDYKKLKDKYDILYENKASVRLLKKKQ